MAEETKEDIIKQIKWTTDKLNLLFISAINSGITVQVDLDELFNNDGQPILVLLKVKTGELSVG